MSKLLQILDEQITVNAINGKDEARLALNNFRECAIPVIETLERDIQWAKETHDYDLGLNSKLERDNAQLRARVAELEAEREPCEAQEQGSREYCQCRSCKGFMALQSALNHSNERVAELEKDLTKRSDRNLDLRLELERVKAERDAFTYSSTQSTECAGCGKRKHTPLRRDEMGGYVCLTCIDNKMDDQEESRALTPAEIATLREALAVGMRACDTADAHLEDNNDSNTLARMEILAAERELKAALALIDATYSHMEIVSVFSGSKGFTSAPDFRELNPTPDDQAVLNALWKSNEQNATHAPHNPNLTPEQVGTSDGWRLLDQDEVNVGKFVPQLKEIQSLSHGKWDHTGWIGNDLDYTYRTKLTRAELAAKRKEGM